jgi:hypothetical protein
MGLIGAGMCLEALGREIDQIYRAFPELRSAGDVAPTERTPKAPRKRAGRRKMSARERREVSRRMKAFWAKRRKAKKGAKSAKAKKVSSKTARESAIIDLA